MIRVLFFTIIFISIPNILLGQFTDDLESYEEGPIFTERWTTWNGINDGIQNALVSTNQAYSGAKSIFMRPGPQDAIVDFMGVASTGVWHAKWQMYIPSGKSAYFNVQGNVDPSANDNQQFLVGDIYFNENNQNQGLVAIANSGHEAVFYSNVWFFVVIEIDFDNSTYRFALGQGNGYSSVGGYLNFGDRFDGINFYSIDPYTKFYVDDFELVEGIWEFDSVPPVAICNDPFTLELDELGTINISPEDIDNGSYDDLNYINLDIDQDSFDCSSIGENEVILTVTDSGGNQDSCSTLITIVDVLGPEVTCPLDTLIVTLGGGNSYTMPNYLDYGIVTATDNCDDQVTILEQTPAIGEELLPGEYDVEIIFVDNYNNTTSCEFILIIEENLSVEDEILESLQIYPNPSSNLINVINPNRIELQSIELIDITGRVLKNDIIFNSSDLYTIDISSLSSATYFLKISDSKNSIIKRILKN